MDDIEVEGPDGVILTFPAGTSRETMKAAMQKRYGGPKAQSAPKKPVDPLEQYARPAAAKPRQYTMPQAKPNLEGVGVPQQTQRQLRGTVQTPQVAPQNAFTAPSMADYAVQRMNAPSTPEEQARGEQYRQARYAADIEAAKVPAWQRGLGQGVAFGFGDEAQAGLNKAFILGQNALADMGIGQRSQFDPEMARLATLDAERAQEEADWQNKPLQSFAGNIAGAVVNPFGGAGYVARGKNLADVAARGAMVGAGQGAAYGLGSGENAQERSQNAFQGAMLGGVLGGGLPLVGAGAKKVASLLPKKPANVRPDVRTLQSQGIDLTYGEMMGGTAKRAEDALATISGGIGKARARGVEQFNRVAINKVLAPIGEKLDDATQAGRDAVDEMVTKVGKAYGDAFKDAVFTADNQFIQRMQTLSQKTMLGADDATLSQAQNALKGMVNNPFMRQGVLSGDDLTSAISQIGQAKRQASLNGNSKLLEFFGGLEREIINNAGRNGSDLRKITKAREAYANSIRVEKAAGMLGNESGVFTPAQLQSAVKSTAGGARRRDFARGKALMQDLSEPAKNVLTPKIGSSGTGERNAVTMMLGAGAAFNPVVLKVFLADLALRGAYSKPVLRLVNNIARASDKKQTVKAINQLQIAAKGSKQAKRALSAIMTNIANQQKANEARKQSQEAQPAM